MKWTNDNPPFDRMFSVTLTLAQWERIVRACHTHSDFHEPCYDEADEIERVIYQDQRTEKP